MQAANHSAGISSALGIMGWSHLDPLLLAALATCSPVLLIGPAGTAKSMVVERIARALGLSWRHYNASLLNYDDLVGIPLPDEFNPNRLKFVYTQDAIWEAEFVFFDEISRCRPDLQNKMFPIIHEKRVGGVGLHQLQHRWAAMNPPAPEDPDMLGGSDYYLGSEALDPALIDRFPFILPVPSWPQMSREDRRRVVSRAADVDLSIGESWLPDLVSQCGQLIEELEDDLHDWRTDYIVSTVDLLEQAKLGQSTRRARMLAGSLVAIHAARMILEGEDADLEYSAELTVTYGLPQTATDTPPERGRVVAIHRQAWEISSLSEDDAWRQVLEELDPVRRIVLADQLDLSDADISRLITQALGAQASDARRVGLAAVIFLAFQRRRNLTAAAWEPLVQLGGKMLEPRAFNQPLRPGPITDLWNDINAWLPLQEDTASIKQRLERNYVLHGFPELWLRYDWKQALEDLRADMDLFNLDEVNPA